MSTRIIKINSCEDCPELGHKGAFGKVSYIPKCELKNKELPYEVTITPFLSASLIEELTPPSWCPLEEYKTCV